MNTATIRQLNHLNQVFYQNHATSFHQSRREFWSGWKELWVDFGQNLVELTLKSRPSFKVLDLGCGNGRFAQFLESHLAPSQLPHCEYVGCDNSAELLALAHHSTTLGSCHYQKADLIELTLVDNLATFLESASADLIVGFGVMHHIPSHQLRARVLNLAIQNLPKQGQTWLSWWQFADSNRYQHKLTPLSQIGLKADQTEADDWLLDWKSNQDLYRYCHSFSQKEIFTSIQESGGKLLKLFKSDQPGDNLNWYSVITK